MHPTHFIQQQGRPMNVGAEFVDVNDLFLCRDNRYIMIEGGTTIYEIAEGIFEFL
jgi:hypothetical protein